MSAGQVFFLDPARQPPKPRTVARSCADGYMIWLGSAAAACTVGFGIYAILFANGASQWPTTLVILALLSILSVHPFGEMILHRNWPVVSYLHFVVQCGLTFAIFWAAAMNWVIIPQSLEYIEENWFLLQNTVLIPFTTQLEQKRLFENDQHVLFGLGITTGILRLLSVIDAWKALGGTIRLVQSRYGFMFPAYAVLFTAACATLVYDDVAATIAPWAVPYSTAALLWQSAMAGIVIIAIVALVIAGGVWGSSMLTHTLGMLLLAPSTLIVTVTSCVTLSRSNLVHTFVNDNWAEIHQFVPPQYAALQPDKYATAAYTPMAAAGASGIILALILLWVVLVHLRCVITLHAVGNELYALARHKTVGTVIEHEGDTVKTPLAGAGTGSMTMAVAAGTSTSTAASGSGSSARYSALGSHHQHDSASASTSFAPYSDADVHHDGGAHSHSNHSSVAVPQSPIGIELNGAGGRASLPPISVPHNAQSPIAGSKSSSSYGGTGHTPRPAGSPTTASSSGAGGFSSVPLEGGTGSSSNAHGVPIPSGAAFGLSDTDYEACKAKATAAYARYLAATGVASDSLMALYHAHWPESELELRVKSASKRGLVRAVTQEARNTLRQYMCCLIPTLLAAIVTIAGMGAGLGQLASVGTCGVLARAPVSVTYSTWFDVTPGVVMSVVNNYPYGSIEWISPHFKSASDHNITVEVTYYAASGSDLPSFGQFMASINDTGYDPRHEPIGTDDNVGGYWFSSLTFAPPAASSSPTAKTCLGARLRVYTGAHLVQSTFSSQRAMINITGNVGDVDLTNIASSSVAPIFSSMEINTDVAPVVLTKVYVDPFVPFDPRSTDHNLRVTSNTGDVSMTTILAPGVAVTTGGTIRTSNVVSGSLTYNCQSGCGNIALTATGSGRISVAQAVVSNNLAVSTDSGVLVMANTGVIVARRADITSNTGKIYLSNYIQAAGNDTHVSSSSDISASALFANQLYVTAKGAAKVSVVEAFMGLSPSTLVKPLIVGNYSDPLISITTDRGDIGVLGFSGNSDFADTLSVAMTSSLGDVRVEINGGGFNGNYTVASHRGSTTVEIDGQEAPAIGVLGEGSSGRNFAYFYSESGDVSVTELASPL